MELIYLSLANRASIILGNAISSLFESVWVMVVFTCGVFVLKSMYFNINVPAAIIVSILMIIMAVMWGMLLNGEGLYEVRGFIIISISIIAVILVLINVLLKLGEKHAKRTGNMSLF